MDDSLDDYDFTPSANTNLASLFGSPLMQKAENASLIYTAPKQPTSSNKAASQVEIKPARSEATNDSPPAKTTESSSSTVLCARAVNVWKLTEANKYEEIGKMGLAIIGIPSQNAFEVILYKEKRNVTSRTKINTKFQWTLSKECFASFSDKNSESWQHWLVKFSSLGDHTVFTSHIEKCGGTLIHSNKMPTNEHSNSSKVEQMSTDSCPETSTTSQNIERDANLVHNNSKHSTQDTEMVQNDSSDSSTRKPSLIARMAKVGQPILPHTHNLSTSDSDDDMIVRQSRPNLTSKPASDMTSRFDSENDVMVSRNRPNITSKKPTQDDVSRSRLIAQNRAVVPQKSQNFPVAAQDFAHRNYAQSFVQDVPTSGNFFMGQPVNCDPGTLSFSNASYDPTLSVLFAENRTYNAEVRLNLAQISDKLNQILNSSSATNSGNNAQSGNAADEENKLLKSKIRVLELKIENLMNDLDRSGQRNSELEAKVDEKEQALQNLTAQFDSLKDTLNKQQDVDEKNEIIDFQKAMIENLEKAEVELSDSIETQKDELRNLKVSFELKTNEILDRHKLEIDGLNEKILSLQSELQTCQNFKDSCQTHLTDVLKQNMNDMYGQVLTSFDSGTPAEPSEICKVLARSIKTATGNIIKGFEQISKQ